MEQPEDPPEPKRTSAAEAHQPPRDQTPSAQPRPSLPQQDGSGERHSNQSQQSQQPHPPAQPPPALRVYRNEDDLRGPGTPPVHPLVCGCEDHWSWNKNDKSHEVRLYGPKQRIAHFHPNWSNGTAGVRGTRVLNGGRFYWEINVSQR